MNKKIKAFMVSIIMFFYLIFPVKSQDILLDDHDKIQLLQTYMIVSEGSNLSVTGEMDQLTKNVFDNFAKRNGFYHENYTLDDIINFIRYKNINRNVETLQG